MDVNRTSLEPGNLPAYEISGIFDEVGNDLETLNLAPETDLRIICKGIRAITSVGMLTWMSFFNRKRQKGVTLSFYECSPIVVRAASMIASGFIEKEEFRSVQMPYSCEDCGKDFDIPFDIETLEKLGFEPPKVKCKACDSDADLIFDEVPEVYLGVFLNAP